MDLREAQGSVTLAACPLPGAASPRWHHRAPSPTPRAYMAANPRWHHHALSPPPASSSHAYRRPRGPGLGHPHSPGSRDSQPLLASPDAITTACTHTRCLQETQGSVTSLPSPASQGNRPPLASPHAIPTTRPGTGCLQEAQGHRAQSFLLSPTLGRHPWDPFGPGPGLALAVPPSIRPDPGPPPSSFHPPSSPRQARAWAQQPRAGPPSPEPRPPSTPPVALESGLRARRVQGAAKEVRGSPPVGRPSDVSVCVRVCRCVSGVPAPPVASAGMGNVQSEPRAASESGSAPRGGRKDPPAAPAPPPAPLAEPPPPPGSPGPRRPPAPLALRLARGSFWTPGPSRPGGLLVPDRPGGRLPAPSALPPAAFDLASPSVEAPATWKTPPAAGTAPQEGQQGQGDLPGPGDPLPLLPVPPNDPPQGSPGPEGAAQTKVYPRGPIPCPPEPKKPPPEKEAARKSWAAPGVPALQDVDPDGAQLLPLPLSLQAPAPPPTAPQRHGLASLPSPGPARPRLSTPTNHLSEPPWVSTVKLAGSLVAGLDCYDLQAGDSD
ncbi:gametogenetin [Tachyglossus aculeatus]|uniref:gametogenetin n=1 Tax=Tachyglossus aculeatus TaxID=9261 RepID=UPI0018F491B5|nr:gametogenetin [Tachyglossus aculeatus]